MPYKLHDILYLSSFGDLYGGGQQSLFYLVINLDKRGFHPHVVLPAEGSFAKRLREHDIRVTVLNLPRVLNINITQNVTALYKLLRLCSEQKIDIIHTDGPRNTFYAGIVARIKRIPLIWHVRVSDHDRYDRLLYLLSSKIILVANALRTRFDWVGSSKFITIYNGVDLSEPRPEKSVPSVREQYGIDRKTLLIAAIARIEPLKGQRYLIEACGRLRDNLDVCVLLIGDIVDSGYRDECKTLARELGIENLLIFVGYQNNIDQFLSEIDLFVLPSLSEAFPRSVIEAMGAGKPVIVTDVGGCSEAVEDKVSGFVVPARDSKALADVIHKLCKDSKLKSKLGQAARVRAEKMFGIVKNVKQTEQVYLNILGKD
jgi:glycosyltransferase involved in cell wall biosynthesis